MTLIPVSDSTGRMPMGLPMGRLTSRRSILGILGPVMSASRRPTRLPFRLSARANRAATVDLPTPPLPLSTATARLMLLYLDADPSSFWGPNTSVFS